MCITMSSLGRALSIEREPCLRLVTMATSSLLNGVTVVAQVELEGFEQAVPRNELMIEFFLLPLRVFVASQVLRVPP